MAKEKKELQAEMKQQFPNDELIKDEKTEEEESVIYEDPEFEIVIWAQDAGQGNKLLLLNLGNTTIRLTEPQFYALTKATQMATKTLIGI